MPLTPCYQTSSLLARMAATETRGVGTFRIWHMATTSLRSKAARSLRDPAMLDQDRATMMEDLGGGMVTMTITRGDLQGILVRPATVRHLSSRTTHQVMKPAHSTAVSFKMKRLGQARLTTSSPSRMRPRLTVRRQDMPDGDWIKLVASPRPTLFIFRKLQSKYKTTRKPGASCLTI